ncbi:hypothetical protein [Actinomadura rubrisoli]|uniref:hypothetical protein n=1 Tax=Actinomadura rubrisoli TaxID=2530368 RepID=UPI001A9CD404|nr:hypothetical protein [Actinomadura rubrisoli]
MTDHPFSGEKLVEISDAERCEQIAGAGRFVIRYRNRGTGYPPGRPGCVVSLTTSAGEDGLPLSSDEPASNLRADSAAMVDFVVASAKAYSDRSPFFEETRCACAGRVRRGPHPPHRPQPRRSRRRAVQRPQGANPGGARGPRPLWDVFGPARIQQTGGGRS